MTSKGIGLRNRQVPPCNNVDPPLGAIVEEESDIEELVQREASVPPQQFEIENAILFSELDSMENVLSSGGQSNLRMTQEVRRSLICANHGQQLRWISN
jgi:hypothetical protein